MDERKTDDIDKIIEGYHILNEMKSFDKERAKKKLFAQIVDAPKRKKRWPQFLRYAAILLLPVLSALLTYVITRDGSRGGQDTKVALTAPKLGVMEYSLPDGSRVWLGGGAKISYSSAFTSDKTRDVAINGECYFDVVSDPNRPFHVVVGDLEVIVKGTQFNCYMKGSEVVVTLVEGLVDVYDLSGSKVATLHPDQQLIYNSIRKESEIKQIDSKPYVAWRDGEIYFQSATLDFVVDRISKQFNVEMEIENDELRKAIINANFTNEDLNNILDVLSNIIGGDYKIVTTEINGIKIKRVILF